MRNRFCVTTLLGVLALSISALDGRTPLEFTEWGTPVNLGQDINTAGADNGPAMLDDGLSLFFSSNRPGGFGNLDIWVSQRSSNEDDWGLPVNLGPHINTGMSEGIPCFSRDGHWIFFNSDDPAGLGGAGGLNNLDLWAAWRPDVHDDFGWEPAAPLGPAVNSTSFDAGAAFLQLPGLTALLYFGSERAGGAADIYAATVTGHRGNPHESDGLVFGPPVRAEDLSSPQNDARPSISADGREVVLQSNRIGTFGSNDLWTSFRESLRDPWPTPINLGPVVNSSSNDLQADLSKDGRTLLFASDRPGGAGNLDLYVTTRRLRR